MSFPKLLALTFLLAFLASTAQVTSVRKWRKTEKDSLENGLFLFDEKSYLQALPIFDSIFNHHPKEEFIKYIYAKCALYRSDKHEDAYIHLSEIYQKNKRVEDIQIDLAQAAHYADKFDEALLYVNEYLQTKHLPFENKKSAEMLRQYISNGKYYTSRPTIAKITGMGSAINTPDDEYAPAIKADESAMIFTYVGPKNIGGRQNIYLQPDPNGNYMEDVYMSYKIGNEFTTAFPLDSLNTNGPESSVTLSNDGSTVFIYKIENDNHGDIYEAKLIGEHYTRPHKLQGQVNTYSWDGYCSLAPDGRTLYFSSERSGGNGGKDIYRASLSADGSWQHIVNLGDTINTPYDEDAPFMHPDGTTLFYSTNGKKSMGGYDVMKATMSPEDSTFKKTENLGSPINSTDDDIYFVMAANSETAYYSSGRKGGKGLRDIYQIEPHFAGARSSLLLVKGEVQYDGDEVPATIKVEIPDKGRLFGTFDANAATGQYLISLPVGEKYKLTFSYKELPVKTLDVDLVGTTGYSEKTFNVDFKEQPQPVSPPPVAVTPTTAPASSYTIATSAPVPVKETAPEPVKTQPVKPKEEPVAKTEFIKTEPAKETPLVKKEEPKVTEPVKTPQSVRQITLVAVDAPKPGIKETKPVTPPVVNTNSIAIKTVTVEPDTQTVFSAAKDGFVPRTRLHEKAMRYIEKYGDITMPGLEFRVQLAAFKIDRNQAYPNLRRYGKIDRVQSPDGYTRIYIGGSFKTLRIAFGLCKRVVLAGHIDAFVSAFYNGNRLTYEDLERIGVFK